MIDVSAAALSAATFVLVFAKVYTWGVPWIMKGR